MKRLIIGFIFFLTALITAAGVGIKSAYCASSINPDAYIDQNIADVNKKTGSQSRIDESEYGFYWYVYNKNYRRFQMLGVQNGVVQAAYSNSKYFRIRGSIKVGSKREQVRNFFGDPIYYYQIGNDYYVISDTNTKDIFLYNGCYYIFYYDSFDQYKLTAVMIIKKKYEENIISRPLQPSFGMLLAYSRQSVDLVNAIRTRRGLRRLAVLKNISDFALYRSNDMVFRHYFSHYTPDGYGPAYLARKQGLKFRYLCENIARGHRSAVSAFEAFLNSKGHRENILNKKVRQIGIGTAFRNDYSMVVTYIMLKR